ncbi:phosphoserine phosphatase SerB [Rheinheimera riviphila]|uniref:Phosphoserine phosphatase n=2 Tax=Rheinheimera riviphila TaxID=1834037 RepID=A0A437QSD7_9GAMM|nr:phosphoserine phosphatase SerB [Rheinheimera riviphila]
MPVSSIRCFGSELLASQLSQILALVAPQQALLRLYQPHPELTPALVLDFAVALPADQVAAIREVAANWPLELVCLNNFVRLTEPGLLVMDMDSTAIQIECIDEIAVLAGVGAEVAAVTARAMNGELDFAQSLRQRVATLANAPEHILQQVLNAVPLMPGLTALVSHLQQQQWQVAIASGGFTFFTEALKQRLDLTATFANVLEIVNGKLTGQVLGEIVDAERKAAVVAELSAQFGLASSQTVAIGDGANDLPMLKVAALGVAFHAKPKVQAAAKAAIRQGSLLQLLYLLESEQA